MRPRMGASLGRSAMAVRYSNPLDELAGIPRMPFFAGITVLVRGLRVNGRLWSLPRVRDPDAAEWLPPDPRDRTATARTECDRPMCCRPGWRLRHRDRHA